MMLALVSAICCWIYLWYRQLRIKRKASLTAVYDLDNLGASRPSDEKLQGNAVICDGR
jgi:hypothetical protein